MTLLFLLNDMDHESPLPQSHGLDRSEGAFENRNLLKSFPKGSLLLRPIFYFG